MTFCAPVNEEGWYLQTVIDERVWRYYRRSCVASGRYPQPVDLVKPKRASAHVLGRDLAPRRLVNQGESCRHYCRAVESVNWPDS